MTRQLAGFALGLVLTVPLLADDWPQWRGPNRDGISKETGLLKEWPKDGPPLRWQADVGTGYSTPSVAGGRVYLQTSALDGKGGGDEFALALDEKTGKEAWKAPIGKVGKNYGPQYPGTRGTPTVDGDRLYCLASDGQLVCLDTTGKEKWRKDLVKDFGGKVGNTPTSFNWAYSESVLVDGEKVVCTPGGEAAALLALNKMTGEVVWKAAVPGGDPADYASIVVAEIDGVRQYVQFLRKGVVGVEAKTGKFLWRYDNTAAGGASMFTPIVAGNKVFTASSAGKGGGGGGGLVELTVAGDKVTAKEVYLEKQIGAGIGGAVLVDGHIYGATREYLFCAELGTGKPKWTAREAAATSVCYADGRIYAHGQQGDVILIEPSPEEYREKGRFKQPARGPNPAWPYPVVANGGLYIRDWNNLWCYDVKAGK